jgi:putative spermidine/putrescine transport system permease protein
METHAAQRTTPMSHIAKAEEGPLATARAPRRASALAWLGVVPFFLFSLMFMILPACALLAGSFRNQAGQLTLENIAALVQRPDIRDAYWLSISISAVTALGGALFGLLLAYAVTQGGLPGWARPMLLTFSGVAANFAGVPLAFAFVATLGRTGLVTVALNALGFNLYQHGFNLYTFTGLSLTYMYFQLPLMVLVITPALDGLKREWREASDILGGSAWQYWRYVGLPLLLPSFLGATILLFGNAFGAYATAYALTGGSLNLVTILIGAQIRGDVLNNPNLGYALALGMIVVMAVSIFGYALLQRRAERWLR